MSLRTFHIVFITCSTALCALFGAWSLRRAAEGGASYAIMGALAALAAIALMIYGVWFWTKLTTTDSD